MRRHRWLVKAWLTWNPDEPGTRASFEAERDAREYARTLTQPLVDIVDLDLGLIVAGRRLLPYPGASQYVTWDTL